MNAKAILRSSRISPQKARLVADQVRGLPVSRALDLLKFSDKKAAHIIYKVLWSATANAENNNGADVDELLKQADQAMYEAEAAGRNTKRYFGASNAP